MYPNFCFSKTNHENLLRMKTQQCLRDAKLCNCKQAACTKSAKKPKNIKRQEGGSILRDKCAAKRPRKLSHTSSRSNSPSENTKPCVTFQLKDRPTKCDYGRNCNETASNCALERERERERAWESERGRECDRKRIRTREHKRDFERNRKPDIIFEHANARETQQERLMQANECNKNEQMRNDDDFNLNKQLQDSCADFLNIIHDNVLETVQSTVEKMLVKYYEQTMVKIENLTMQVESNATLLNKAYIDLLEKIMEQNENSVNQFKFVAQMLIDQQQQQMSTQNFHMQRETENVYQANAQHETGDECLINANAMNATVDYQQQQQKQQSEQQEAQTLRESQQQHKAKQQQTREQQQQQQQQHIQQQQQQHVQTEQHATQQTHTHPPMAYQYNNNLHYQGKMMPMSYLDMAYQNYVMWQNSNSLCGHNHNHNCCNCNCHTKMHNSKKPTFPCHRTKVDAVSASATARSCRRLAKGISSPSLPNVFHTKVKYRAKAATCQMAASNCMPSLTKLTAQHFHLPHQHDMRCNSCTNAIGMRKTISMKTNPSMNASVFTQSTTHI